ncbi:expressed unknown protein [Seminavis robusta]|uniref:Uncharacterized protein n=1 Tax=Seminavis robusta TaxID=568900 RepID=A0A9N8HVR4_9STRA|nr:expressed unknown protein [Seminavis robusta]|eukprot:Sro1991_g309800.1 n/a (158) ;mRNA; r:10899-11372
MASIRPRNRITNIFSGVCNRAAAQLESLSEETFVIRPQPPQQEQQKYTASFLRQQKEIEDQIMTRNAQKAEEEARRRCLEVIRNHLISYLETTPPEQATFEEWLAVLHPDNVKMGVLDSRFQIPGNPWATVFEEEIAMRTKPIKPILQRSISRAMAA